MGALAKSQRSSNATTHTAMSEEAHYKKQTENLRYELERMRDFLNWIEDKKLDQSHEELWTEFEDWENKKQIHPYNL